jgi:hypothetical protein
MICAARPAGHRDRRQGRPGAKGKDGRAPHLVAALAHGTGASLGQVAADEEGNEIPAGRELLRALAGLASAVVTIGAMHARHDTAQLIPAGAPTAR